MTSRDGSERRLKSSLEKRAQGAFEPATDAGFRPSPARIRGPISARSARDRGLAQLAQKALEATDVEELLKSAAPVIARSMMAACCAVFAYERSREILRLVAGAGWAKEAVGLEVPLAEEPCARLAIERGTAPIRPGGRQRPPLSALLRCRGAVSGILVSIESRSMPFGVLGVFSRPDVAFAREDSRHVRAAGRMLGMAVDRLRAEEALRLSDERLRMVVGNAPIVLFAADRNGVFTLAEGKGLSALGVEPGEVVGRSANEIYQRLPQVCGDLRRALAGESFLSVLEMSGLVFESWYRPLYDASGNLCGATGVATDITRRRSAEEALRQSEQKYRSLFEHANDVIFIIDPDSQRLLEVNEKAVQRLGYSREELRAMTLADICPALSDGGVMAVAEAVKAGGSLIFEHRHRRKDGAEVPVETSSRLIEYGGRKVLLHFVRDIAERKSAEDALRRARDELERRVRERTANLLAACERLEQEIEQRRRAEDKIRERETELAHVVRLSTMGEMAATMAHELNQPLAAIANYAGGCLRRLQAGTASQGHLLEATEQITAQAQRAGEIIHRLRSFVRKREPRRMRVDVNEAVREAIGFSLPEARRFGVAVKLDLAQELPAVLADLVQIEQVVLNLLRNGIEAMRGIQGADRLLTVATTADEGFVQIAVRDRGVGLSPETTERLFHPFFTTKPHGMGMGLAISHSIVGAHGGRLWAESPPGGGTVFRFTLPIPGDSSHEP